MIIRNVGIVSLFAAGMTGCASVPITNVSLDLLEDALDLSPSQLEGRAEAGEARAQYSLSIVYRYGLNGTDRDEARAGELRRKAVATRGYTPITQYIAGLNGNPGRTAIINIPRYDVNAYEAQLNDKCATALVANRENSAAFDACMGQDNFYRLAQKWNSAT